MGPERWKRQRQIEELRRRCLSPGFEETDFVRLSVSPKGTDSPEQGRLILEAAATAPFGSPRRLVVIDGWEELAPESAPWLESYLRSPNPRACLVLCADRFGPRGKELPKIWERESGVVRVIWCDSPDPLRWVLEQARARGKRIHPTAADRLIRHLGADPSALDLALESLSLLADPAPEITPAHVEALIPPSLRETAFDILDAAAGGQPGRAMEMLHQALAHGRITADQFLGALGWSLRQRGNRFFNLRLRHLGRGHGPAPSNQQRLRQGLFEVFQADLRLKRGHPLPELLADALLAKLSA